jgi:hypothetical protein
VRSESPKCTHVEAREAARVPPATSGSRQTRHLAARISALLARRPDSPPSVLSGVREMSHFMVRFLHRDGYRGTTWHFEYTSWSASWDALSAVLGSVDVVIGPPKLLRQRLP